MPLSYRLGNDEAPAQIAPEAEPAEVGEPSPAAGTLTGRPIFEASRNSTVYRDMGHK